MATNEREVAVLNLAGALELYSDLLEQAKDMDQQVRMLRDNILRAMALRRLDHVLADGYEAVRQLRHHAPQLNEDRAARILEEQGRLQECQVTSLDQERARAVIDELFRHGALSKDELPYVYVRPTEALIVRRVEVPEEVAEEVTVERRAA